MKLGKSKLSKVGGRVATVKETNDIAKKMKSRTKVYSNRVLRGV